jgi:LysM repeat protein
MQIETIKKMTGISRVLIICLSVLININFIFSQELNYPLKKVNGVECYIYTVQQAEGFYRIGKNFNTTEAVIKSFNPQITDGLKVGMQIFIPVKPSATPGISYVEHVVEKKQTIFRIRRLYKITEDELLEHNPQIKDRSIQVGEVLRIPVKNEEDESIQKNKNGNKATDTEKKHNKETQKDTNGFHDMFRPQKSDTLDIAFLLPFMLEQKPELSDSRFVEFYAGALIAIQKAKAQGINFNIYAFDVEKSDLKLMEILQDTIFKKIDLIVGPAYSNQVSIIGDFARMQKIKTLIPFSSKIFDIAINPYLYQFNPGQDVELKILQEIIQKKNNRSNFIFAEIPSISGNDDGLLLSGQLKDYMQMNNMGFNTVLFNQEYAENLREAIRPSVENILIFNTSRLSNLNAYMRHLNVLTDSFQIKIYEPYAWRSSKTKRPDSFYLSVFKNKFSDTSYDAYMTQFGNLFDWLPSSELPRYDLLGYDLLNYFISHIISNKQETLLSYPINEGIQSDLKFERSSVKSGFINNTLNQYE